MTKDEALAFDLALEALEKSTDNFPANVQHRKAITAIKQARSSPVQEPVAWVCYGAPGKRDIDFEEADINKLPIGTQLYTTPPAAQPAPVPLTLGQKQRLWSSVGNKPTLKDRVNAYGLAIEAAHGITKENT